MKNKKFAVLYLLMAILCLLFLLRQQGSAMMFATMAGACLMALISIQSYFFSDRFSFARVWLNLLSTLVSVAFFGLLLQFDIAYGWKVILAIGLVIFGLSCVFYVWALFVLRSVSDYELGTVYRVTELEKYERYELTRWSAMPMRFADFPTSTRNKEYTMDSAISERRGYAEIYPKTGRKSDDSPEAIFVPQWSSPKTVLLSWGRRAGTSLKIVESSTIRDTDDYPPAA